jgi:hypothetical protein
MHPALGVIPPENKSPHNSTRVAPARWASKPDATESIQISTFISAGIISDIFKKIYLFNIQINQNNFNKSYIIRFRPLHLIMPTGLSLFKGKKKGSICFPPYFIK